MRESGQLSANTLGELIDILTKLNDNPEVVSVRIDDMSGVTKIGLMVTKINPKA